MSTTLPNGTDTLFSGNVKIERTVLIEDKMDTSQIAVDFLISADSPVEAYAFCMDSALVAEGERLVRQKGLSSPGITERGIPVSCDETGKRLGSPIGTIDPQAAQRYFYTITHKYLGGED